MTAWANVATLVKTKNLEGGLVVRMSQQPSFLLYEGIEVHFVPPVLDAPRKAMVESVRHISDETYLVFFSDIYSIEIAQKLIGCSCLIHRSQLVEANEQSEASWIGFEVFDQEYGYIGKVDEVIENPYQLLLSVSLRDRQVLIPFVDEIVREVDEAKSSIDVCIPKGLLDL